MKKTYCDFCNRDLSEDFPQMEVGSLTTIHEVSVLSPEDVSPSTVTTKKRLQTREYDLCAECLKKVFKALEDKKSKSK